MSNSIVLTLTGPDRVGIVEEVTRVLLNLGGNVENSRMARLGGEFAILMLVTLAEEQVELIDPAFIALKSEGYVISLSKTRRSPNDIRPGWICYDVEVQGGDHPGIVYEIAQSLSRHGINIESLETATTPAPMSGTTLFSLNARISVPPSLEENIWRGELNEAAQQANVDVSMKRVE